MKRRYFPLRLLVAAASIFFLIPLGSAWAEDGLSLTGYGRTKAGALLEDGSFFMFESTLDAKLLWKLGDAALFADLALQEFRGAAPALELRELYLSYTGPSFDLRIGKQQVIWGKSDAVFITDLVSPKDLSRFLTPDFAELRRAVTGVRINGYAGGHNLDLVWLPLFTSAIPPSADSLWAVAMPYPVVPAITPASLPELNIKNGEYFAKYSYMGSSFDISLMGGWFWNDMPSFTVTARPPALALTGEYYRTTAAGYSAAATLGPLILRSEGVIQLGRRYQAAFTAFPLGYSEKNSVQYLVGADFSILGATFGLQYMQEIILEYEDALMGERVTNTVTIMAVRSFAREALRFETLAYIGLDAPDALVKAQLVWKISDAFELSGGTWLFFGQSGQFGQYDLNDSVFASAKISF